MKFDSPPELVSATLTTLHKVRHDFTYGRVTWSESECERDIAFIKAC